MIGCPFKVISSDFHQISDRIKEDSITWEEYSTTHSEKGATYVLTNIQLKGKLIFRFNIQYRNNFKPFLMLLDAKTKNQSIIVGIPAPFCLLLITVLTPVALAYGVIQIIVILIVVIVFNLIYISSEIRDFIEDLNL